MNEAQATAPGRRLQVGGTLDPRKHVYIERPEDAELLQLLLAGEYVNVLTSRQMGKSSLMAKTMLALRQKDVAVASIDLAAELAGAEDAETWFKALVGKLARGLGLRVDIGAWWAERPSDATGQRLQGFFREVVCVRITGPVVVFFDEIDSTLKHDFTDALFTAIRGMYNERGLEPAYERVTFCLLGVAAPNELIKDRRTTTYNVGRTLELRDFDPSRDDLGPLATQLSVEPHAAGAMLARVLYWTGGQPFLTVQQCEALRVAKAISPEAVDGHVERTFGSLERLSGEPHFRQILRFVETRLSGGREALETYGQVLKGERVRERTTGAHLELRLSGLVKRDGEGCLVVRNRIYERLFDTKWLAATLPQRAMAIGRYRRFAAAAGIGLAVALLLATFFGVRYQREYQLTRGLERTAAAKIRVEGNVDNGFSLRLKQSIDQSTFDTVLRSFPRPESIRAIEFEAETLAPRSSVEDIQVLQSLTALQTLSVSNTPVSSVEPLKGLTALQTLDLSNTPVSSVEPLKGLTALQTLDLSNTPVSNVEPLKGLTALQTLNLYNTPVSNVEPLKGLTALQTLNLYNTPVSNVEPLKGLTALQTLNLYNTPVSSVEPLKGLTALQTLVLSNTPVSIVEPLKGLTALQTLDLSNTPVSSVEPLKGLTALQTLDLSNTPVSSVEPLKGLTALQTLVLSNTRVSNVEPLKGLTALQTLSVSGTRVSNVEPLKGLTALQTLNLYNTPVSNVEPLKGLTALQTLVLSNTRVSSVEPLKGLTALQTLVLSNTRVSSVEPLKGLTALQTLVLSNTRVSNVEPLKGLTALQRFDLSRTPVSSVEPLKGLTALQTLVLSNTPVSNVEPLKGLTALQTLDLSRTEVSNVEPLRELRQLRVLDVSFTRIETLVPLYGLPDLRHVLVDGTRVPSAEASRFNKRRSDSTSSSDAALF